MQAELLTGLPAHTPVAVVQHASLPQQRHAVCTLGSLTDTLYAQQLGSPSVIVVGDVLVGMQALEGTGDNTPHPHPDTARAAA
jgi:uroporphyrin-III C-methyltransferase